MKKFLPTSYNFSVNKSIKNLEGFTLVELLVVISILAILSVLGYAVFSNLGAQAKARNNVRRSDIKSIASALEVNRSADTYVVLLANQFSNNKIPSDPKTGNVYCANTTADAQPLDPAVVWTSTCPANYSTLGAAPLAGTKWKICVWLEVETNPAKAAQAFCMLSVQ